MSRSRVLFAALVLGGLALPDSGSGQSFASAGLTADQANPARTMTAAERLRPWAGAPALFPPADPRATSTESPAPVVQARVRNRRGVPLMVAGGILFVAGAIAGDDVGTILMLGGAGIGAWGAYVYFGGEVPD
jgi:hypothetical protein